MPDVRCACGKALRVPERLLGKKVKCPSCGAVFAATDTRPDEGPPTAMSQTKILALDSDELTAVSVRGDTGPIRFTCACGKELIARRGTEGQKLVCVECGKTNKVPGESNTAKRTRKEQPAEAGADRKCPRCREPLPVGEMHCGKCHLNLVTGRVELPPDPDAEEVAGLVESMAASLRTPVYGLGVPLILAGVAVAYLPLEGWPAILLRVVVFSFLAFPSLRSSALGEGMGPKSKLFVAFKEEWLLPWLSTLLATVILFLPLTIAAWVFRPSDAGPVEVFPLLARNIVTMLLTIATGIALSIVVMRAGGFGKAMYGVDPFGMLETAKTLPLETLLAVFYLAGVVFLGLAASALLGWFDKHGIVCSVVLLYTGGVWGSFLGATFRRKKAMIPAVPTTAPSGERREA